MGLRKKGHLGSQSTLKPSLKLKFNEYAEGRNYLGGYRLALNNNKSDAAYVRTCSAYAVFAAAGLPTPRCTYAHVTVNGRDLGVYTVVEEIKKPFLQRALRNPDGTLYEGTACDFRPEFLGGFEQETNKAPTQPGGSRRGLRYRSECRRRDLRGRPGAGRRSRRAVSILGRGDGGLASRCYSGNANNYFLYADPGAEGRFRFIPWGPDSAFRPESRAQVPKSVLAFGAITNRLYALSGPRQRFYAQQTQILDEVWDAESAIAAVREAAASIAPHLPADEQAGFADAVAAVEAVMAERQGVIAEALEDGFPDWEAGMRSLPCRIPLGPVSGTFSTTWDTLADNVFGAGTATLNLELGRRERLVPGHWGPGGHDQ